MRKIEKGKEPIEWLCYRKTHGVHYEAKPQLREALLVEQGYLCAYCMQRIYENNSRIEHVLSRKNHPELQLDYKNMVLCCNGKSGADYHCDRSKGESDVSFEFNDALVDTLSYDSRGAIKSSNATWDNEINSVLNLNNDLLKRNREETINGLIEGIKKWNLANLKEVIEKWKAKDRDGKLKPYCGVAIYYLEKKILKFNR